MNTKTLNNIILPELSVNELKTNIISDREYLNNLLDDITKGNKTDNYLLESVAYDVIDNIEENEKELFLATQGITPHPLKLKGNEVFAIDLDDTVGVFTGDFRRAVGLDEKKSVVDVYNDYPIAIEEPPYKLWKHYSGDKEKYVNDIVYYGNKGYLYYNQPIRRNADLVIKWLMDYCDGRVMFITARPETMLKATKFWLENIVGVKDPNIVFSYDKEKVAGFDVLIDDFHGHCQKVYKGGRKAIHMVQPFTYEKLEDYIPGFYTMAKNWNDVKKVIEG